MKSFAHIQDVDIRSILDEYIDNFHVTIVGCKVKRYLSTGDKICVMEISFLCQIIKFKIQKHIHNPAKKLLRTWHNACDFKSIFCLHAAGDCQCK
jgi:hypothetical protein